MLWSQDKFQKGELSPLMYARTSVNAYYDSVKKATNVVSLPQGGFDKRFGLRHIVELESGVTNHLNTFFEVFNYNGEATYVVVFYSNNIDIYLGDFRVANVSGTGLTDLQIRNIDHTVLQNKFLVTTIPNNSGDTPPKELVRTANGAQAANGFTSTTLTLAATIGGLAAANMVLPVTFTTAGGATLPTTTPTLIADKYTYYARLISTTEFSIHNTYEEAYNNINPYTVSGFGSGNNVNFLNTFQLNNISFQNVPVFDFEQDYDAQFFQLSGLTVGTTVTISTFDALTAGSQTTFFATRHVNGLFVGAGGIARIDSVSGSPSTATVQVLKTFEHGSASGQRIKGTLAFVGEPAWSTTRGYPTKVSSYQNRAFYANTRLIKNGVWGSVINDYRDFYIGDGDDDDAIDWLPSSNNINVVRYLLPYRSFTVHTNTGIFSTPLGQTQAITPTNFALLLQDSTPPTNVQPIAIDNQIIVMSGDDVYALAWDGYNQSYESNIISVLSEHLISEPIDVAAYIDRDRAGSRYVFVVNADGGLPVYQTLVAENVSGWTLQETLQPYGVSQFRKATSDVNGNVWFMVQREEYDVSSPSTTAITGYGSTSDPSDADYERYLLATGANIDSSQPTLSYFTTTGSLPTTIPQIEVGRYYFVLGDDANQVYVYKSYDEALADVGTYTNGIIIKNAGTNSSINAITTFVDTFHLEQLDYSKYTDSTVTYEGMASAAVTGYDAGSNEYLEATGLGLSAYIPTKITFSTTGTLPSTTPAISAGTEYFARAISETTPDRFKVYSTFYEAENDYNEYVINSAGTGTNTVRPQPYYIPNLDRFEGMEVQVNADGYSYKGQVYNGNLPTVANGIPTILTSAEIGFGIPVTIEPLPLSIAMGQNIKTTNLVEPKHVRSVEFMFDSTIGGTVNGQDIELTSFDQVMIGQPPEERSGLYKFNTMRGWDDFKVQTITIEHDEPYPFRLLGLFYKVEV